MTPQFASLVNPTFHRALELVERMRAGRDVDLDRANAAFRNELSQAETTASQAGYPVKPEHFQLAKRALVFWVDEILTLNDPNWEHHTLEWHYYQSHDRAWLFYVDAETKARRASADVIEVFYLALVLGFEGDIADGFHRVGNPIPAEMSEEQARSRWAEELAREIPQKQKSPPPAKPALEGDVHPLWGASMFKGAFRWAALLAVVAGILLYFTFAD